MMMSLEQATELARAYLVAKPFPNPAYRWVVPAGRAMLDGWYFNFVFERVDGRALSDEDAAGGAPGFRVMAVDGRVQVIGWEEYDERKLGEG